MANDPWAEFRTSGTDPTDVWAEFRQPTTGREDQRIKNDLTGALSTTPNDLQKPYTPVKSQYSEVYEPSQDMGPGFSQMQQAMGTQQNYTDQQMNAAQQGVNIDANAGVSTYRANFAAKKEQRDAAVVKEIFAKNGPVPIRTGADSLSGDVEWFNPNSKQWEVAGDSASGMIPKAIPAVGEVIGGIAGAFSPYAPGVAAPVGAGIGRGIGQKIKNKIGEAMGVEDDLRDQPSATSEGLKAFGLNAALNAVTIGLPSAYRMARHGKDVVNPEQARSIIGSYNANVKAVDDINNAMQGVTDKRLQVSSARVAALPDANGQVNPDAKVLLSKEEPLLLGTTEELKNREIARRTNNENVIEFYWQNEVNNPYALQNITPDNWQQNLKGEYDNFKDGVLGPYQQRAEQAVQEAEQAAAQQPQMGKLDKTKLGQRVRATIQKAFDESKERETEAWANYTKEAKYQSSGLGSEYKVPADKKLTNAIKMLNDLKEKAFLKTQKNQAERYTPIEVDGDGIDLAVLDRTIKDLNAEGNRAAMGAVESDISDANRNMLNNALKSARTKFLKDKPELQTALDEAQAETIRHHAEFERSFMGRFLVKDDLYGGMRIADPKVLDQVMRNQDKVGAAQLAQLVNGNPGAKKAVVDYVNAYYNKGFTRMLKDGTRILDPKKHQLFVEQVLPNVAPFLSKAEIAEFKQLGGVAKNVIKQQQAWDSAVEKWGQTDAGKLGQRLSNETFVNQFFQPNKSFANTNYAFIKRNLGEHNLEKVRAGIMSEITNRARDGTTGRIDLKKVVDLVTPLKDRMDMYFGPDLVSNLTKLQKVAQAANVESIRGLKPDGSSFMSTASKVVLGPLSAENRKIQFLKGLRVKSEAARLEKALYDRDELPRLIDEIQGRLGRNQNRSAAGVLVIGSTGDDAGLNDVGY